MSNGSVLRTRTRRIAAVVAVLFGLASVGAGGSVLAGRDPGYLVHVPLVMFNTAMGLLYAFTGILAWRGAAAHRALAAAIAGVNAVVLAYIVLLYRSGGGTAIDSVRAMVLRTVVWVVLLLLFLWTNRTPRDSA